MDFLTKRGGFKEKGVRKGDFGEESWRVLEELGEPERLGTDVFFGEMGVGEMLIKIICFVKSGIFVVQTEKGCDSKIL